MRIVCPKCGDHIPVPRRPSGTTNLQGVNVTGRVNVGGDGISIGPGGSISFGPGGQISLGGPPRVTTGCQTCGALIEYSSADVLE